MDIDNRDFNYHVLWSEEKQAYIGLCDEFPSISYTCDNPFTTFRALIALVGDAILEREKNA